MFGGAYCWYYWPEQVKSMEGMADFRFECVLRGHGHKLHLPTALMQREIR